MRYSSFVIAASTLLELASSQEVPDYDYVHDLQHLQSKTEAEANTSTGDSDGSALALATNKTATMMMEAILGNGK